METYSEAVNAARGEVRGLVELERALELRPRLFDAKEFERKGKICFAQHDWKGAVTNFSQAVECDANCSAFAWHAYGMASVPEPRMELERLKMELSSDAPPSGAAAPAPSESEAVESLCTGLASESDC